jgi:competence ComEA-like helix-hairpin-helix protein
MGKGFFFFNRSQRIGILVLLSLIVIAFALTIVIPILFKNKEAKIDTDFLREVAAFKSSLKEKERKFGQANSFYPFQNSDKSNKKEAKYELFKFNPNKVDSATFVRLGIKPYIARNIIKYRNKGGLFRTVDSFSKVYGISEEKFQELKPYIVLEEIQQKEDITSVQKNDSTQRTKLTYIVKKDTILDLNSADTLNLQMIKGIGRGIAKNIVNYRNRLGGFCNVEQLKEVYGINEEVYEKIKSSFITETPKIEKIDVNKASVERLKAHPYIKTFQRAVVIYEYRRKKIRLNNISQLKHLEEFTADDWKKLEPYLSFK